MSPALPLPLLLTLSFSVSVPHPLFKVLSGCVPSQDALFSYRMFLSPNHVFFLWFPAVAEGQSIPDSWGTLPTVCSHIPLYLSHWGLPSIMISFLLNRKPSFQPRTWCVAGSCLGLFSAYCVLTFWKGDRCESQLPKALLYGIHPFTRVGS